MDFWLWMVDRCSIWPVTKEFRCGGVLENTLPLGDNTTTHNFLMPPTHMCTFFVCDSSKQELAMSRGNGFL